MVFSVLFLIALRSYKRKENGIVLLLIALRSYKRKENSIYFIEFTSGTHLRSNRLMILKPTACKVGISGS